MAVRGRTKEKRRKLDDYPTPAWVVEELLDKVRLPKGKWLEPTAGAGALIRTVLNHPVGMDVEFLAVEKDPGRFNTLINVEMQDPRVLLAICGDILDDGTMAIVEEHVPIDLVITNPPFYCAEPLIRQCQRLNTPICLLLPVTFMGTEGRADLHKLWTPDVYALSSRPSFTGDGGTDAMEYAWYYWPRQTAQHRSAGKFRVLTCDKYREQKKRRHKDG